MLAFSLHFIEFSQIIFFGISSLLDQRVFVKKESKPTLRDTDSLHPKETYRGKENTISMTVHNKADFICSFKQIQNFPFHTLVCIFQIFVSGSDNLQTRLRMVEDIRNAGPSTVDQYVVLGTVAHFKSEIKSEIEMLLAPASSLMP